MTRTSLKAFNCSLARTADIIGDKWTLLILRDAFFGASTFSQFQKSLGVARNILADRLEKLVEHDVLEKVPTRPGVERYTYHLTERGQALVPVLIAITQWGDKWLFGEGAEPLRFIDREQGQPIRTVDVQSLDGRSLTATDIIPTPGPAADERILQASGNRSKST
jgi:DNA-binding HxlR family transcriptional regulator